MEALAQDLRHAFRQLVRRPGFTAVAVLSLALGIGGNAVIFAFFDGFVLHPFAYPEPDRVVTIGSTFPRMSSEERFIEAISVPEFADIQSARTIRAIAAFDGGNRNISGGDRPERVMTALAITDLFGPFGLRPALGRILERVRAWDLAAARRVTHYIAISELSRQRIQDFYGRDATIVHPPVAVERFSVGEPEDFFLVVSELVRHKRIDNALAAARRAGKPIKVVGGGPELSRLRREYGDRATFLGRRSDSELADLSQRAIALVVPNVEEFGIAAVEAQAAGRPVLAADAGGARETVVPGQTGVLVPPEDIDALAEGMAETDWGGFDPQAIRQHARRFSTEAFKQRFTATVAELAGVEPSGASDAST